MRFISIVLSAIIVAFLGTGVLAVIFELDLEKNSIWAIMIIIAVIFVVIAYLIKGRAEGCPKCGKSFGMKEISRITIGTRPTTIDVTRNVKNSKGTVIRTYTEAVPATLYFYDCVDECKFCGHRRNVERQATYRN